MSHVLAIAFFLLSAIVSLPNVVTAFEDDPSFRINTKRDDDKVEFKAEEGKANFSIQSPFGISQAEIERVGNHWPDSVTLRLYLKGLGNLKVTNGRDTLEAALLSNADKHPVRLWVNGNEDSPLDNKSPFWMTVRMVGKDGKPTETIPMVDGHFEMRLPKALFEGNPKSIRIHWIDFYR
jgi:hypothetical protein